MCIHIYIYIYMLHVHIYACTCVIFFEDGLKHVKTTNYSGELCLNVCKRSKTFADSICLTGVGRPSVEDSAQQKIQSP